MPFEFMSSKIPEVILVKARKFPDQRGFFLESYKKSDFISNNIAFDFVQDNYSFSVKNVLRGLHYQLNPKSQGKLVHVLRGKIFDVAVDIRQGSPTYGEYVGLELSAEDHHLLYVPGGFAHGFLALSEEVDVVYKVTDEYAPEFDRGIIWNDPDLNIKWPTQNPILSEKDAELPQFSQAENNFYYEEMKA
jgi:dTDP-4-dehydrorhamnose 3,5-epimerase